MASDEIDWVVTVGATANPATLKKIPVRAANAIRREDRTLVFFDDVDEPPVAYFNSDYWASCIQAERDDDDE